MKFGGSNASIGLIKNIATLGSLAGGIHFEVYQKGVTITCLHVSAHKNPDNHMRYDYTAKLHIQNSISSQDIEVTGYVDLNETREIREIVDIKLHPSSQMELLKEIGCVPNF